jgi:hypothetical protein
VDAWQQQNGPGGPVGRGGGIRTHGLFVPNEARYQTALRPDFTGLPPGRGRAGGIHDFRTRCKPIFRNGGGRSPVSELAVAGRPREGDDVADVAHAGDEHQQALETKAESGVGDGAVFPEVRIP